MHGTVAVGIAAALIGAASLATAGEEMLARSSKLGVDILVTTDEAGAWCGERVELAVRAQDPALFGRPAFAALMRKVGTLLAQECPAIEAIGVAGRDRDDAVRLDAAWTATRAGGWTLEADVVDIALDDADLEGAAPLASPSTASATTASDRPVEPVAADLDIEARIERLIANHSSGGWGPDDGGGMVRTKEGCRVYIDDFSSEPVRVHQPNNVLETRNADGEHHFLLASWDGDCIDGYATGEGTRRYVWRSERSRLDLDWVGTDERSGAFHWGLPIDDGVRLRAEDLPTAWGAEVSSFTFDLAETDLPGTLRYRVDGRSGGQWQLFLDPLDRFAARSNAELDELVLAVDAAVRSRTTDPTRPRHIAVWAGGGHFIYLTRVDADGIVERKQRNWPFGSKYDQAPVTRDGLAGETLAAWEKRHDAAFRMSLVLTLRHDLADAEATWPLPTPLAGGRRDREQAWELVLGAVATDVVVHAGGNRLILFNPLLNVLVVADYVPGAVDERRPPEIARVGLVPASALDPDLELAVAGRRAAAAARVERFEAADKTDLDLADADTGQLGAYLADVVDRHRAVRDDPAVSAFSKTLTNGFLRPLIAYEESDDVVFGHAAMPTVTVDVPRGDGEPAAFFHFAQALEDPAWAWDEDAVEKVNWIASAPDLVAHASPVVAYETAAQRGEEMAMLARLVGGRRLLDHKLTGGIAAEAPNAPLAEGLWMPKPPAEVTMLGGKVSGGCRARFETLYSSAWGSGSGFSPEHFMLYLDRERDLLFGVWASTEAQEVLAMGRLQETGGALVATPLDAADPRHDPRGDERRLAKLLGASDSSPGDGRWSLRFRATEGGGMSVAMGDNATVAPPKVFERCKVVASR